MTEKQTMRNLLVKVDVGASESDGSGVRDEMATN